MDPKANQPAFPLKFFQVQKRLTLHVTDHIYPRLESQRIAQNYILTCGYEILLILNCGHLGLLKIGWMPVSLMAAQRSLMSLELQVRLTIILEKHLKRAFIILVSTSIHRNWCPLSLGPKQVRHPENMCFGAFLSKTSNLVSKLKLQIIPKT